MINIVGGRTSTLKRGRDYFTKETTIKWYYRLLSLIYLHPSKNNGGWGGDPLLHIIQKKVVSSVKEQLQWQSLQFTTNQNLRLFFFLVLPMKDNYRQNLF